MAGCSDKLPTTVKQVAATKGLIAFWDFENTEDHVWQSYYDETIIKRSFPIYLRQIGDNNRYGVGDWPYIDENSKLKIDNTGPFGKSVRFNQGYIYGEIPREEFNETLLDLKGTKPFTMIAWVKFSGNRHMVAGIWDEGGWDRYAGRRQAALFAGLFNQKGVIAHVSSTGAASFPQSDIDGSQYARLRAIDGKAFENEEWVSIAMTYDPENKLVSAYLNGTLTPYSIADPVTQDVMQNKTIPMANPFKFGTPIFSPTSFQLKYNGYDYRNSPIKEHWLWVDLENDNIQYRQVGKQSDEKFRVTFDIFRRQTSILDEPVISDVSDGKLLYLALKNHIQVGDIINTTLEKLNGDVWEKVGLEIEKEVQMGAPFTFGRALGLDEDGLDHGSVNIFIDGVAIFNRVLSSAELKELSFKENR